MPKEAIHTMLKNVICGRSYGRLILKGETVDGDCWVQWVEKLKRNITFGYQLFFFRVLLCLCK